MDLLQAPTAKDDCRELWKVVAKMAKYLNSLGSKFRIIYDEQGSADGLQLTEGNTTLRIKSHPTSASAANLFPWQPYLSPHTGTGTPPADQGRRIRIVPAAVDGRLPSNLNVEILVPPSQSDPYFVWLESNQDPNGNGTGLSYQHGATLPDQPTIIDDGTGNVPGTAYELLFAVTSTATGVNLPPVLQNHNTALSLTPVPIKLAMSTTGAQVSQRKLLWMPPGAASSFPTFDTVSGS